MPENLIDRLNGLVAIPVTPFTKEGRLDEAAYIQIAARMIAHGVDVLTPNGNTGEFYSLSRAEAQRVLEMTVETTLGRGLVVAGVGHDVETASEMARAAQAAGASAVMVHQPVHPYRSVGGWIRYHQLVSSAAPNLGLIAYVRDPRITPSALKALADGCDALIGIKYAIPDVFALGSSVSHVGAERVAWICGLAERWAPFFWLSGARGFTSGLVNVAPAIALELLQALRTGAMQRAMELWRLALPMEELRARDGDANNVSALKEALFQLGLCNRTVRAPIGELESSERAAVEQLLSAWELHVSRAPESLSTS